MSHFFGIMNYFCSGKYPKSIVYAVLNVLAQYSGGSNNFLVDINV